ncbi:hypothetical protein [Treponema pedis]|uniref:hypothetical protein n=1 Tax=Treponema pedis TaxID=409322 RepID=UPI0003F8D70F
MKPKPCIYSQPNYLIRTAIAREQKQFIKIAFAVHLSAVISAERYRSDSEALKSAVLNFVFFVMLKNKIEQSAAQSCLRKKLSLSEILTDRVFENRRSRYKDNEKYTSVYIFHFRVLLTQNSRHLNHRRPWRKEAYLVYVEDTFLPCDAVIVRRFKRDDPHG